MPTKLETTNSGATQRIWDIINSGDLEDLQEVYAEDVRWRVPGEDEMQGIDSYIEYIREFNGAFPDASYEVHDQFVDDDVVVTHFTFRGTHEGAIQGIEPTGKTVEGEGVTINRFQDGKAVEDINFWDNLAFLEQVGAIDPQSD